MSTRDSAIGIAADRMNDAILRATQYLCSCNFGSEREIQLEAPFDLWSLRFGKFSGAWCLTVRNDNDEFLLISAPIVVRIAAIQRIDALYLLLQQEHQDTLDKINAATRTAESWVRNQIERPA